MIILIHFSDETFFFSQTRETACSIASKNNFGACSEVLKAAEFQENQLYKHGDATKPNGNYDQ